MHMEHLKDISSKELVRGLPKIKFEKDKVCDACQICKQKKVSHKPKKMVSTSRPLQLLHMDLFGPIPTTSLGGKSYCFVIVDDYSRYTWTFFLATKVESLNVFTSFAKRVQNQKGYLITNIRSDHGREFENSKIGALCDDFGISHNFSAPRTPQQNGVAERKNRSLQEAARTMLNEYGLPKYFWAEAVNCACFVLNRVILRNFLLKTPYDLFNDKKPKVSFFRVFGCKCFVLNTKDHLSKFDSKTFEGIFLGYSNNSMAYRVYNKSTLVVEESINVTFDETNPFLRRTNIVNVDDMDNDLRTLDISDTLQGNPKEIDLGEQPSSSQGGNEEAINDASNLDNSQELPKDWTYKKDHPSDQILGNPSSGVRTRRSL
ncbi:hypothetical protein RJ640_022355 [Escallonia rubra]|uniref:Integrase catalytic domain-containing protein n=1 Tax=Escallonia rubra TaxID=112253 RepID=A0AA88U0F1_9ASTE|nr:hypothetical protein RJ640_022355 [Escallonia rubra]